MSGEIDRALTREGITARVPWDFLPQGRRSPAMPGKESGWVLRHWRLLEFALILRSYGRRRCAEKGPLGAATWDSLTMCRSSVIATAGRRAASSFLMTRLGTNLAKIRPA
jgi:hypothetical protein